MSCTFKTIIYLHGFQSSSQSQKAQALAAYLEKHSPSIDFYSPNLPFSPAATCELVNREIQRIEKPVLMGSSMGAYYASYFSQLLRVPTVLINPVVDASLLFKSLIGQQVENNYTAESYCFGQNDLDKLIEINLPITSPELIFNLLETGDEVLDYRLAEKKYKICTQKIFEGGDHRFQNFENCLPEILQFYNSAYQKR